MYIVYYIYMKPINILKAMTIDACVKNRSVYKIRKKLKRIGDLRVYTIFF